MPERKKNNLLIQSRVHTKHILIDSGFRKLNLPTLIDSEDYFE